MPRGLEGAVSFLFILCFLEQVDKGGHNLLHFFLLGRGYLINGKLDKGLLLVEVIHIYVVNRGQRGELNRM